MHVLFQHTCILNKNLHEAQPLGLQRAHARERELLRRLRRLEPELNSQCPSLISILNETAEH